MRTNVLIGFASLMVLAGAEEALAQQTTTPSAGAPAVSEPPAPSDKSPPLAGSETGTRHPSAGAPETGYHGSNEPTASTGANLPSGQDVQPKASSGSATGDGEKK